MELRQLKYFEAVARLLNFSKAAEELHIAQPPLSRQIQNLEDELGVLLIDRSSRPLKLTNAGLFFYDQSVQVLERIHELKRATRHLGSEQKRWMGIGFMPSALYSHIPKAIQRFNLEYPNIDISLSELTSVQQVEALKSGLIDVGFGRLVISDDAISSITLSQDQLMVAVSSASPVAEQQTMTMQAIAQHKLILYPSTPRPNYADQILNHFRSRGLEVRDTYETNTLQTALGLVAAGMGVTLLPESVRLMQRSDVAYVDIEEQGVVSPLVMVMRKNDHSAHLKHFREYVSLPGAMSSDGSEQAG